ncbi:hydrophobe/amphiphile efflux-1 (HAE1) family protein [Roseovarius sp. MBR-154]|jgi:HAE1 family hydrophobic/amphiphilic exporter-1
MIRVFIDRPILASVLALMLVIFGAVALLVLPVSRYPNVVPPQVRTSATFTGSDAATVAQTVATPLEQAINGVDGLIYIQSSSSNDGSAVVTATFSVGTEGDQAATDVLNEVNQARPQLPQDVIDRGITIETASPQLTAVISLFSETGTFDELFVSNYADINIVDRIRRLPGVGRVVNFTQRNYAMRVWLDPAKLESFGLDAVDVIASVREENAAVSGGTLGGSPAPEDQVFSYVATAEGRLMLAQEFRDIVLRAEPGGATVTLGDVARVELGAQTYGSAARYSGKVAAQIGIFQSPDANALALLDAIKAEMAVVEERLPPGLGYEIGFDTSRFVSAAVIEVVKTLGLAILLVVLVVYLFLQRGVATLIPSIVIPVALTGSFAVMFPLGFSVNQLTLLGLILAVGLVVDDAIVVVENVQRHLDDGEPPETATGSAVSEVLGPIIATTAVLFALFVPVAFIPGISGLLYNQFSLTVAIAVGLSTLMSLTLTPALSRRLLRRVERAPAAPFRAFNAGLDRLGRGYCAVLDRLSGHKAVAVIALVVVATITAGLFSQRPTGFVPSEDQGYFVINVQLPEAAAFQRTREVVFEIEERVREIPGVRDVVAVAGRSFVGNVNAPYFGFLIPILEPWAERGPDTSATALIERLRGEFVGYQKARVQIFNAPPIPGVGSTGGVRLQMQGLDFQETDALAAQAEEFIGALNQRPEIGSAFTTFTASVPQYEFDIARDKAEQAGVPVRRLFDVTQANLGSAFVNEFTRFGQTYNVFVQAEPAARDSVADLADLSVRNRDGAPVPLDTLLDARVATGPQAISRYNLFPAVEIQAQTAPGASSGEVVAAVEETADEVLGPGFGFEWTGATFQQKQSAGWTPLIFTLAIGFVFLVLAAQLESLSMPLVIMLSVPFAALGGIGALTVAGLDLDIFGQIGLLMLVGLSAKNAILIVEFARSQRMDGLGPVEAALSAARLRLRPILMTAVSFILGALPLILSTGAGANARISLGTTVIGGMLATTVLSLLLVPVLYVIVEDLRARRLGKG